MEIAILVYPRFAALDAVGPYEVLSRLPGAKVTFVAEQAVPQRTDTTQLAILADATIGELPHPDIVLVPGGPGQTDLMEDGPVHEWLRAAHETSTWTTSVCTGSLVLAAAGLLDGKRATSNWQAIGELRALGVDAVEERVVFDGKVATSAGVTAGIDMRFISPLTSAAIRWRRRSSWESSTTRSRRLTPARRTRRPRRSWRPCGLTHALSNTLPEVEHARGGRESQHARQGSTVHLWIADAPLRAWGHCVFREPSGADR
jgi:putative intracellular protease/amidase